jgi:tRNA 2-thiouridine synthesizing protein B
MSTLHTVNKSPFTHGTLASCLLICTQNDGILLLEDGVFGALPNTPCADRLQELIEHGVKVYALNSDIKARGLQERLLANIVLSDYTGFVQLSIDHRCVQSWY